MIRRRGLIIVLNRCNCSSGVFHAISYSFFEQLGHYYTQILFYTLIHCIFGNYLFQCMMFVLVGIFLFEEI